MRSPSSLTRVEKQDWLPSFPYPGNPLQSKKLTLKSGREKSLLRKHPWIFSGAVERIEGSPETGETVGVYSAEGDFLAWGAFSPRSQILVRVWSFKQEEEPEKDHLRYRLEKAISLREGMVDPEKTNAIRLVHAESDGIPGLIVDRYDEFLVMQCLTAGAEYWRESFADLLTELTGVQNVYERSDVDVRALEGLSVRTGLLKGKEPPDGLSILENGLKFMVDVKKGHKTGFYLDQRDNRRRVRGLSAGKAVLNCFCYTGGFSVYALAGSAKSVLSVDTSADAIQLGKENLLLNGMDAMRADWWEGDVFEVLRKLRDQARSFDLVILDPPKFAPTASQAEKAARGYKDINRLAFKLLRPGGKLVTFSCSGGINAEFFQKIVAGAALDAGVDAQILEHLSQAPDHPVALSFPEGAYLKGLVCSI